MSAGQVYAFVLANRDRDYVCVVEYDRFDASNAGAIALNQITRAFHMIAYPANDNRRAHRTEHCFRLPHDAAALTMFLAGELPP